MDNISRAGISIYWGARLFNQAERIWNKQCADALRELGYNVVLPQEEAEWFKLSDGSYDLDALAKDCIEKSRECTVGCYTLDGPDVDSGAALEAGAKISHKMDTGEGFILGIRTDFRGNSEDSITGVNAMFRLLDSIIVYTENDRNVEELVRLVDCEIQKWLKSRAA